MTKKEITEDLITKYGTTLEKYYKLPSILTVDTAMNTWWYNSSDIRGLRLSNLGFGVLDSLLKIPNYPIKFENTTMNSWCLVDLSRKVKHPYYFHNNAKSSDLIIVFFDEKEAILASLFGNLKKFIESYD